MHFNINLGYFLNFEVQISNLNLETQILELKIPKEIGPMKRLGIQTKLPNPENKMPNKSSFSKGIEIPGLENKISNAVDFIKRQGSHDQGFHHPKKHRLCKKP